MRSMLIGFVFAVGCSPGFNSKDGTVDTTTLDPNAEGGWESATGLDSLVDEMDSDVCEGLEDSFDNDVDVQSAQATSYFYGIYQRYNEEWRGEEQWILHPSENLSAYEDWQGFDGEACYVTWSMSARQKEATGCPSCDFALEVDGMIDRTKTTCPEGIWENEQEEQWSEIYNISIGGGNSEVSYQSGTIVGVGYSTTSAFNFLSEGSCLWF